MWDGVKKTKGLIALLKLQAVKSNVLLSGDLYSKVSRVILQTRVEKMNLTIFDSYSGPSLTSLDINHFAGWKSGRDGGSIEGPERLKKDAWWCLFQNQNPFLQCFVCMNYMETWAVMLEKLL